MEANNVVEYALSQIGTAEDPLGSNKQKYGAMLDQLPWYLRKDSSGKEFIHHVNGFDWCTSFVDASFISTYTLAEARKMLFRPAMNDYGSVVKYAYNYFRAAGRGYTKEEYDPKPGDVIYFQNSQGLSHTGIVVAVDSTTVTTVEGNSGTHSYYVAKHNYRKVNSYIYGYGHPDYGEPEPPEPKKNGWEREDGKWYFYDNGEKVKSDWVKWRGGWYYLGADGAMLTGWQTIDGKIYHLDDSGRMAQDEWWGKYFADMTGACSDRGGAWHEEKNGKWYGDSTGWYPANRTVMIDGKSYRFDDKGYLVE